MWSHDVLAPQANASSFVLSQLHYKYLRTPHLHHSQLHNRTFIWALQLQFQIQATPKCLFSHLSSVASFHPHHQVKCLIMVKNHLHLLHRNLRPNQNQRELLLLCPISLSTIIPHACRISTVYNSESKTLRKCLVGSC